MKRVTTLLAIVFSVTAGFAQNGTGILPETFALDGAVTEQTIKTLYASDGKGMTLDPIYDGPNTPDGMYQVGIELVGHTSRNPKLLSFSVDQIAYAGGDLIVYRIEMFNYTSGQWVTAATATSAGANPTRQNERPFMGPLITPQVHGEDYVAPGTGEVRTRVFWTSPRPFTTIFIDFAGWEQAWD